MPSDAARPSRIPVTILTGFLGSGKTTVLNHLVRQPELAGALVIVNEFGAVGLDHLLVAHSTEDTVIQMSSGCLCCTVRSDLVTTLRQIGWRFAREGRRQFDRVLIETTGLADPVPIIHTLVTDTFIAGHYRLDGIVTTVDMVAGAHTLDAHPESVKQAAVADCLLLTKADQAAPQAVQQMTRRLRRINPSAPCLPVRDGVVEPRRLLGLGLFGPAGKIGDVARWLDEEAYARSDPALMDMAGDDGNSRDHGHGHSHDRVRDEHDEHSHRHDANRHDDHIRAFCFTLDTPLDPDAVQSWLQTVKAAMGPDMLRIKGILNIRGQDGSTVIQGVQHVFHPPVRLDAWPGDDRQSRLVFITRDIERQAIEATLAGLAPAGHIRWHR